MNKGGKRPNSGRKKIEGKQIKIIIENDMLECIESDIEGKTQAEKIRNCIKSGLSNLRRIKNEKV